MTRRYSLSDPTDGVAIFHPDARDEIQSLDATQSRKALTAIINCLESPAPESVIEKPYETCQELEQLRQGELRLYVKLVTDVPGYNILWIFSVKKHQYRNLGKYDARACQRVAALGDITTEEEAERYRKEIERYLERNDALNLDDLKQLREQL